MLITAEGVRNIESAAAGRVKDIFVAPGDVVRAGQKVAQIEQPDLVQQLADAQAELANLMARQEKVGEFHERSSSNFDAVTAQKRVELRSLLANDKNQIEWLQKNLSGYQELAAKGYASQQKLNEAMVKLNEAKAEQIRHADALAALDSDTTTRKIERERETLDLEVKTEQGRRQVAALREKSTRMAFLQSPYDGVVVEQKVNLGELVEVGKPVLGVLPGLAQVEGEDGHQHIPLVATLFLPPKDGKRVRPDMVVQIVPSTAKREEYGFIRARITSVAAVPSTPEGMMRTLKNRQLVESLSKEGAPFEAQAILEEDHGTTSGFRWSSSAGPDQVIGPGTLCSADVVVREQRLIALLMPAIRRLLGDFVR